MFLLALDGLFADRPAPDVLERRTRLNVSVEAFPVEEWRRIFEVNLLGHVAMIQALLSALVRSKGRVVNISSVGGRVAVATCGLYVGTKFAPEAVSDALRREITPAGVGVVVVEPGGVRTGMLGRASTKVREGGAGMTAEQRQRYGGLVQAVVGQTEAAATWSVPPEAITARNPRPRYTVGRDAALVTRMARLLPDRALDHVLARTLRPYFPRTDA